MPSYLNFKLKIALEETVEDVEENIIIIIRDAIISVVRERDKIGKALPPPPPPPPWMVFQMIIVVINVTCEKGTWWVEERERERRGEDTRFEVG